jgi:hypothetical protein
MVYCIAMNGFSILRVALTVLTAIIVSLAWTPNSAADEEVQRSVVMMIFEEQEEASREIVEAVGGHLSDLDVDFGSRIVGPRSSEEIANIQLAGEVAADKSVIAVFWYASLEDQVYLYLSGNDGNRILVRKLENAAQARGRAEGLAIIVRSSIIALLQGGIIGIAVHESAQMETGAGASQKNAPTPEKVGKSVQDGRDSDESVEEEGSGPADSLRLFMRLGYNVGIRSEDDPFVNGFGLDLLLHLNRFLALTAGYTVFFPVQGRGAFATAKVYRHPFRFGLNGGIRVKRVRLGLSLALVLDYTTQEVTDLAPDIDANDDMNDLTVGLLPMLDVVIPITGRLGIFLAAGAEFFFNSRRYTASSGGEKELLVDTWPVQPCFMAGIRVNLV